MTLQVAGAATLRLLLLTCLALCGGTWLLGTQLQWKVQQWLPPNWMWSMDGLPPRQQGPQMEGDQISPPALVYDLGEYPRKAVAHLVHVGLIGVWLHHEVWFA